MKHDPLYLKKLFSKPFRLQKAGGQTNRNYIVTLKDKKFFVRLPWEGVIDRKIEGSNILALSKSKKLKSILPRYYVYVLRKKNILGPKDGAVFNVPDGTMVTEFIPGREFTAQDFPKTAYQRRLTQMFHAFHASKVSFCNSYNVFVDEVAKYRVAAKKLPIGSLVSPMRAMLLEQIEKEAEKKLPLLKKGTPTHNDFLFQNIIVGNNKKLYLLDFEYAGMNKKGGISYDFGFFFADNLFRKPAITKKLFEEFLHIVDQVYKRKLNRQQIYWAAVAALLVQVWWGILRYFSVSSKERPYFKEYVQKRVKGVLKLYSELKRKES